MAAMQNIAAVLSQIEVEWVTKKRSNANKSKVRLLEGLEVASPIKAPKALVFA